MHRGKILHQATKLHPSSIKDIVEAAGYRYGTFFKHIKSKDLAYSIIAKYGKVMRKDFSVEFPEMANMPHLKFIKQDNIGLSVEQLQSELNDLRHKYSTILEKHTTAMEELFKLRDENRILKERVTK